MDYSTIEKLDQTGLVKTICTPKSHNGIWKYGEDGALANYEELAQTFGITTAQIVHVKQTHTAAVRVVTKENGGEEVLRPESVSGYDGMITNESNLLLATLQADCVPIFLLDPVKCVIGMIHSGWKGTANLIGVNAVRKMKEAFGCNPADILTAMGPCICGDCYEVGEDLLEPFAVHYAEEEMARFFKPGVKEGKFYLDLPEAIRIALVREGLKEENIAGPFSCTLHDGVFMSYRGYKARTLESSSDPLKAAGLPRPSVGGSARMLTGIMLK